MTTIIRNSALTLEIAKPFENVEGILMVTPGEEPILCLESGESILLDAQLSYYASQGEFQGFSFEDFAILRGDIRISIDEENDTYVIAFVCQPFTKEEGSDVILLATNANLTLVGDNHEEAI